MNESALRDNALEVLRAIASDPGAATAARLDAADALREQGDALFALQEVVGELGEDERRVLLVLARRLLQGQRTYGLLRAATDGRNWLEERSEELQDVLVYTAIAEVAAVTKGGG